MCLDVLQVLDILILINVENSLIIESLELAIIELVEDELSGQSTLLMLCRASHNVEEQGVVGEGNGTHDDTETGDAGLVRGWLALNVVHQFSGLELPFTFLAHFFFEILNLLHKEDSLSAI